MYSQFQSILLKACLIAFTISHLFLSNKSCIFHIKILFSDHSAFFNFSSYLSLNSNLFSMLSFSLSLCCLASRDSGFICF